MKTLSQSEFEALPESDRRLFRAISRPTYLYNGTSNSTPKPITEYIPVLIPLAEAEAALKRFAEFTEIIVSANAYMSLLKVPSEILVKYNVDADKIATKVKKQIIKKGLTEALTKLKDIKPQ